MGSGFWVIRMLRGVIIGIAIGIMFTCAGIWLYFATGLAPVATADRPMPFEREVADAALSAHLRKQSRQSSRVSVSEESYLAAVNTYRENCAICHGVPVPGRRKTAVTDGMYPTPPQLFEPGGETDDPIFDNYWKIENGIRLTGMPSFRGFLTEAQIWQVSQLLTNAEKMSPTVKTALTSWSDSSCPAK